METQKLKGILSIAGAVLMQFVINNKYIFQKIL